jgi:biopolymer transport protein ExbB
MRSVLSRHAAAMGVALISMHIGAAAQPGLGESPPPPRLTLWDMFNQGGPILWVIIMLSFVALVMAFYYFFTVTPTREVSPGFVKQALTALRTGDLRSAYELCEGREEMMPNVLRAGLRMHGHDRYVVQEAMESEGERNAAALWQKISYLNNIGVIAPLLGLLGTVWGMMQAFGAIALDDSQVKGLNMANAVSQAMITTAAGLMLAIPALVVYYYLRGRVVKIVSEVEMHATEMIEIISGREG